jgi:hypothetical protein
VKTDEQIVEAVRDGRRKGQDLMVGRYGQEVFAMIARPWLKTKPTLYNYLSEFKAAREAALKK